MYIERFEFRDGATGWHLAGAGLGAFELLVGRSGAGKTRIVEALRRVQRFGVDASFAPGAMAWTLRFQHDGASYEWQGATEITAARDTRVVRERLARDGQVLAERTADAITVVGRAIPMPGRVSRAGSLLAAITDDSGVAQAGHGLRRVVFPEREPTLSLRCARETQTSIEQAIRAIASTRASIQEQLEPARARSWSAFLEQAAITPSAARYIAPIQELVSRLDKLAWLYALQELSASERDDIEALFVRIFPDVAALRAFWAPPGTPGAAGGAGDELPELAIRAQGTEHWIPAAQMAASMRRSLGLILDLDFAPPSSVLIIDDLEADLGVDVLPVVIAHLRSRAASQGCQILATSRHPYIIDDVPVTTWKLVRRRGSEVDIEAVTSLPGHDTEPRHRAFRELLELAELGDQVS
ncbi:MAG TPA: hypothetical protein VNM90_04865 [Haliangium sp.]|nr:hypothetical protein [Haliangium sp.]